MRRQQEGGVTDASLCQLASLQPAHQQQPAAAGGAPAPAPAATEAEAAPLPAGLQALSVSKLSITDATLARLPSSVTSLSLRGCRRISDSGMLQVLLQCPGLARLDVKGCYQLTAAAFGAHTPFASQQAGDREQQPSSSGDSSSSEGGAASERQAAFRRVVSTAAGVRLQRATLPKQACTRDVLAWLAGQASSSGGGERGPWSEQWAPLQRLELGLGAWSSIDELDLLSLIEWCPLLKTLLLPAAPASNRLCRALVKCCRVLQSVALTDCDELTDSGLAALLDNCPALASLDCSGCSMVTGAGVFSRGGAVPGAAGPQFALRTLRLDGCSLADATVLDIAGSCRHLETLSLRDCLNLTSAAAGAALWCCLNLRQLYLGGMQAARARLPRRGMPPRFAQVAAACGAPCPGDDPLAALRQCHQDGTQARASALSLVVLPTSRGTTEGDTDWVCVLLGLRRHGLSWQFERL